MFSHGVAFAAAEENGGQKWVEHSAGNAHHGDDDDQDEDPDEQNSVDGVIVGLKDWDLTSNRSMCQLSTHESLILLKFKKIKQPHL